MSKRYISLYPIITILVMTIFSTLAPAHPLEGQTAPPIKAQTLDGKPFDLARVNEEMVVLDFWATWCPPCRKGLPLLQQFYDWARQNKKPVAVLTINLKEQHGKVRSYWNKEKFTMPVVMDINGRIAQSYAVRGIPQTVVIHRGKVVQVHVGYSPSMTDLLKSTTKKLLDKNTKN